MKIILVDFWCTSIAYLVGSQVLVKFCTISRQPQLESHTEQQIILRLRTSPLEFCPRVVRASFDAAFMKQWNQLLNGDGWKCEHLFSLSYEYWVEFLKMSILSILPYIYIYSFPIRINSFEISTRNLQLFNHKTEKLKPSLFSSKKINSHHVLFQFTQIR